MLGINFKSKIRNCYRGSQAMIKYVLKHLIHQRQTCGKYCCMTKWYDFFLIESTITRDIYQNLLKQFISPKMTTLTENMQQMLFSIKMAPIIISVWSPNF
jgi:hypothetical protein